ncbi:MAG: SPOR domain-containing protein [Alphaproteobacteria bacterium]
MSDNNNNDLSENKETQTEENTEDKVYFFKSKPEQDTGYDEAPVADEFQADEKLHSYEYDKFTYNEFSTSEPQKQEEDIPFLKDDNLSDDFLDYTSEQKIESVEQVEPLQPETPQPDTDLNPSLHIPRDQHITTEKPNKFIFKSIIGALAVGVVLGGGYIMFDSTPETGEVVVISQENPLKEEPIDPKGMEIKNLDKEVYDVLGNEEGEEKVERLVPIAEKPIVIKDQTKKVKEKVVAKADKNADKYELQIEEAKEQPVKKQEKKKEVKKAKPAKKKQPVKVATSSTGWKVQVASVGSDAQAKATYKSLGKKIPVVANYRLYIEKAVVKGKTYHRVQLVGMTSKDDANKVCKAIKSSGGSCIVKK